jgi:hypothetical protein
MTVEWHQGHYNAIAKDIRSEFPMDKQLAKDEHNSRRDYMVARSTLADLAMRLAARFKKADPEFNVFSWLDQCSPDPENYPISDLWEESDAE